MISEYTLATDEEGEGSRLAPSESFWTARWRAIEAPPDLSAVARGEEYRFLRRVLPAVERGGLDVLDCGCGLGQWTLFLSRRGHRVVGLDFSRETIARLNQRHGDLFRWGDFLDLPWPEASFDLVINWGGIEHREEGPRAALAEARRVLRPGGCLAVTTPCHNRRLEWLLRGRGPWSVDPATPGAVFYQHRFRPGELRDQLTQAGFTDPRVRVLGGATGARRMLAHELAGLGRRLSPRLAWHLARAAGVVLRPWVGHLVICVGRVPR